MTKTGTNGLAMLLVTSPIGVQLIRRRGVAVQYNWSPKGRQAKRLGRAFDPGQRKAPDRAGSALLSRETGRSPFAFSNIVSRYRRWLETFAINAKLDDLPPPANCTANGSRLLQQPRAASMTLKTDGEWRDRTCSTQPEGKLYSGRVSQCYLLNGHKPPGDISPSQSEVSKTKDCHNRIGMVWYGILEFNVPFETV